MLGGNAVFDQYPERSDLRLTFPSESICMHELFLRENLFVAVAQAGQLRRCRFRESGYLLYIVTFA